MTKQLQHRWEQDSQEGMGVWGVPLAVLALPLAVLALPLAVLVSR